MDKETLDKQRTKEVLTKIAMEKVRKRLEYGDTTVIQNIVSKATEKITTSMNDRITQLEGYILQNNVALNARINVLESFIRLHNISEQIPEHLSVKLHQIINEL